MIYLSVSCLFVWGLTEGHSVALAILKLVSSRPVWPPACSTLPASASPRSYSFSLRACPPAPLSWLRRV